MKEIWAAGTTCLKQIQGSSQTELMAQQGTLRRLRSAAVKLVCLRSEGEEFSQLKDHLMLQQLQFHTKTVWWRLKSTHRAMANMTLTSRRIIFTTMTVTTSIMICQRLKHLPPALPPKHKETYFKIWSVLIITRAFVKQLPMCPRCGPSEIRTFFFSKVKMNLTV